MCTGVLGWGQFVSQYVVRDKRPGWSYVCRPYPLPWLLIFRLGIILWLVIIMSMFVGCICWEFFSWGVYEAALLWFMPHPTAYNMPRLYGFIILVMGGCLVEVWGIRWWSLFVAKGSYFAWIFFSSFKLSSMDHSLGMLEKGRKFSIWLTPWLMYG